MPKLSKELQREHRALILREIVRDPNVSINELSRRLSLNQEYIAKHYKKIRLSRAKRINRQTIEVEVAKTEELFNELAKEAFYILRNGRNNNERIAAIRTIGTLAKDLLNIKFDAGIFERKLGELKTVTFEQVLQLIYDGRASEEPPKIEG